MAHLFIDFVDGKSVKKYMKKEYTYILVKFRSS